MKKAVMFIAFFMISIMLVLGFSACSPVQEYVPDGRNDIMLGTSVNSLKRTLGEPKDICYDVADTPFDVYEYNETIYGFPETSYYRFSKSFFGQKLCLVTYYYEDVSFETAQQLLEQFCETFKGHYKDVKGYYEKQTQTTDNVSIHKLIGTTDGATGISLELDYMEGDFIVDIQKQE